MKNIYSSKDFKYAVRKSYLPYKEYKKFSYRNLFPGASVQELGLAREGFFYIQKFYQKKLKILIPYFICRDVPDTLKSLGIDYDYYQVKQNLEVDLEELKLRVRESGCDFILLVNYFGFSKTIKPILDAMRELNVKVIEDNAHGFLSKDENGELLGTRAEWGMFSFRKSFPIPNGGLLYGTKWQPDDTVSIQRRPTGWKYRVKDCLRNIVGIISPKIFIKILKLFRKKHLLQDEEVCGFTLESPVEIENLLSHYDFVKNSNNRRTLYAALLSQSEALGMTPIFIHLDKNVVPYCFPFTAKKNVLEIEKSLNALGLEMFKWPDLTQESALHLEDYFKEIWAVRLMW